MLAAVWLTLLAFTAALPAASAMEATFSGEEFLSYKFEEEVIIYKTENIELDFKTGYGDALLFYTGDDKQYITIGLVNGTLYISTYSGREQEPAMSYPAGQTTRLDDNQWHSVKVSRSIQQLAAFIDNIHESEESLTGNFSNFGSGELYIGGKPDHLQLPGTKARQNLVGCLRNVNLRAEKLRLDLLQMGSENNALLNSSGSIKYDKCEQVTLEPPISLLKPEHYLTLNSLGNTRDKFISLTLRTHVTDGLILYAVGDRGETFAVEVVQEHLYIILHDGKFSTRSKLCEEPINDGQMHTVVIEMRPWGAAVTTDGYARSIMVGKKADALDLTSPLFLGGLDYSRPNLYINPLVYTATLKRAFTGCLKDLKIDGKLENLQSIAKEQNIPVANQCLSNTTSCSGLACQYRESLNVENTLRFNGSQYFRTSVFSSPSRSFAEDVLIRFKTAHFYGALFATENENNGDYMRIYIRDGRVVLSCNISNSLYREEVPGLVSSTKWQLLQVTRLNSKITITLNGKSTVKDDVKQSPKDLLVVEKLWLAPRMLLTKLEETVDPQAGSMALPFIGHVSVFVFNGVDYLQQLSKGVEINKLSHTCELTDDPLPPLDIVSVVHSPILIPTPDYIPITSFTLQFRPRDKSGLLMYGESNAGYVLMELLNRNLIFYYGVLRGDSKRVKIESNKPLEKDEWHLVSMAVLPESNIVIILDGTRYEEALVTDQRVLLEKVFIAGAESYTALDGIMLSNYGFNGCLGSVELNGQRLKLIDETKSDPLSKAGCPEKEGCREKTCDNGGECKELLDYTLYCECSMTTYTGPTCSDEPKVYSFGNSNKSLTYTFPEVTDRWNDTLALRLLTTQYETDILKIVSKSPSSDYIELLVRKRHIMVRYNLGARKHSLLMNRNKVNDGQYHLIKLERYGANATLTVDDKEMSRYPNDLLNVVNLEWKVHIGGCYGNQSFRGNIAGLVINGEDILSQQEKLQEVPCVKTSTRKKNRWPTISTDSKDEIIVEASGDETCGELCSLDSNLETIIPKVSLRPYSSTSSQSNTRDVSTAKTSNKLKSTESTASSIPPDKLSTLPPISVFDIMKNIPLLAGISGAVLVTFIIILIIACRLMKKPSPPRKACATTSHTEPYANGIDTDLNSSISVGQTHPTKEWYV